MNEKHFFQYLSRPMRFIWFEPDDLFIAFLCIFAGIFSSKLFWLAGILLTWYYMRVKKNYPRGFFAHSQYYYGIIKLRHYPVSFQKIFIE